MVPSPMGPRNHSKSRRQVVAPTTGSLGGFQRLGLEGKHVKSYVYLIDEHTYLANGQPFKLLGITYLVGKIKFKLLFQGPLAK